MRQALLASLLATAEARAADADRLSFQLDAAAHWPGGLGATAGDTESIALSSLAPMVHELGLAWGVEVGSLASELVLRAGWGWADGRLPPGSRIGNAAGLRYTYRALPLAIGWRMTLAPWAVRPFIGLDAGGRFAQAGYERQGAEPLEGEWGFAAGLRGIAGLHADISAPLSARLFAEARWSRAVRVEGGPNIDLDGFGVGLALLASFDRPEPGALAPPTEAARGEPLLRDYGAAGTSRLELASQIIRRADEAMKVRRFIEAEQLYREGVGLLPRDPETQKNLEAPVLVDWARALVEIGRSAEARVLLRRALELDPELRAAHALLQRIGR